MTKSELLRKPLEERREYILTLLDKKGVSEEESFGMFSKKGSNRCKALIKKCVKKVVNNTAIRQSEFEDYVRAEVTKVERYDHYAEITDSAVREYIYYWLELAIETANYEWADDFAY